MSLFLSTPFPLLTQTSLPLSLQGDVCILKIEFGEDYVDTHTKKESQIVTLKAARQAPEQDVLLHGSQGTSQTI